MGCLPLVDGAVSAGKSVGLGIFKSVQDGLVLGVEGDAKREGGKIEKNRKRVFLFSFHLSKISSSMQVPAR